MNIEILKGGSSVLTWAKSLIMSENIPCYTFFEILLVPQIGDRSGKLSCITFEVNESGLDNGLIEQYYMKNYSIDISRRDDIDLSKVEEICSINDSDFSYYSSPIKGCFDKPIGRISAITRLDKGKLIQRLITKTSNDIAVSISNCKLINASKCIDQYFISAEKNKINMSDFANSIKESSGCKDVLVWEYDNKTSFLNITGTTLRNKKMSMQEGMGLAGTSIRDNNIINVGDLMDQESLYKEHSTGLQHRSVAEVNHWASATLYPVVIGNFKVGVLGVYGFRVNGFNNIDHIVYKRFVEKFKHIHSNMKYIEDNERRSSLINISPAISATLDAISNLHDVEDILTRARGLFDLILVKDKENEGTKTYVRKLLKEAEEYVSICKEEAKKGSLKKLRLKNESLSNIFNEIKPRFEQLSVRGIHLKFNDPGDAIVNVDRRVLKQALINLIENAHYSLSKLRSGKTKVIKVNYSETNNHVLIEVIDNGEGLPPEIAPNIFKFFVTSKPEGEGFGIGLANAKLGIERHGGSLTVESRFGSDCKFIISLKKKDVIEKKVKLIG